MIEIVLDNTAPNQTINFYGDTSQYQLAFTTSNGVLSIDITRDGVRVWGGWRVTHGNPLIPYRYISEGFGNFVAVSDYQKDPVYGDFNKSAHFYYVPVAEVADAFPSR